MLFCFTLFIYQIVPTGRHNGREEGEVGIKKNEILFNLFIISSERHLTTET